MSCFAVPAVGTAAWDYRPVFSCGVLQPAASFHDQFVRRFSVSSILFGRESLFDYDDAEIFSQMGEAINRIRQYTSCGKNRFLKDTLTQDAIAYNLAKLGIWSKQLSKPVREAHAELRVLGRFRNQLVHDAKTVSSEVLWQNTQEVLELDLPTIQAHPQRCEESFNLSLPSRSSTPAPAQLQKEIGQRGRRIAHYLSRIHGKKGFATNQKLQDAIAYNLMIIGEASYNLDAEEKETVWAALNTLTEVRNQLAHPEDHPDARTASWLLQVLIERVGNAVSGVRENFAPQARVPVKDPLPAWATR